MSSTWKTREETFHGSKWGFVVIALVILIVLSLLGAIFYLIGEGIKGAAQDPSGIFFYSGTTLGLVIIAVLIAIKIGIIAMTSVSSFFGFIHGILGHIWALFTNIYLLVLTVILTIVLLVALFGAVASDVQISFSNPIVIAVLVLLLIIFFPFAIFLIDQFSYEHE